MKISRISLVLLLLALLVTSLFSLTACLSEEDVYLKEEMDSMLSELESALAAKDEKTDSDILAAKADYTAKASALEAEIAADNAPSISLFESLGFERCAHRRDWLRRGGGYVDVYDYQLLL